MSDNDDPNASSQGGEVEVVEQHVDSQGEPQNLDADSPKAERNHDKLYAKLGITDDDPPIASDDAPTDAEDGSSTTDSHDPQPPSGADDVVDDVDRVEPADETVVDDDDREFGDPEIHDLGRVPDAEWAKMPKEAQDRIVGLRGAYKVAARKLHELEANQESIEQQKGLAEYGQNMLKFAEQNGIADDVFDQWVGLAPTINQGGQQAIDTLLGFAQQLGWQPQAAAPAVEQSTASDVLPPKLQVLVDDGVLSPLEAAEIDKGYASANPQSAVPSAAPAQQQQTAPQAPARPQQANADQRVQQAAVRVGERMEAAKQRLGASYSKLQPEIEREVRSRAQQEGVTPESWPALVDTVVDLVVARHKQPTKRVRNGTPAQSSTTAQQASKPLTARQRFYKEHVR